MEKTGEEGLVLHDPKIEAMRKHAGSKGAPHRMLPKLLHNGIYLKVARGEYLFTDIHGDYSGDLGHAQPGDGCFHGRSLDQAPVSRGIGNLEQVTGKRLIRDYQFFDSMKIWIFLDQFQLDPQGNRVEDRQSKLL